MKKTLFSIFFLLPFFLFSQYDIYTKFKKTEIIEDLNFIKDGPEIRRKYIRLISKATNSRFLYFLLKLITIKINEMTKNTESNLTKSLIF